MGEGFPKVAFHLPYAAGSIDVYVSGVSSGDPPGQEHGGSFHYPVIILLVQAYQETVVGKLPLQVGQRPGTSGGGDGAQAIG
jgi:hypothetical protein